MNIFINSEKFIVNKDYMLGLEIIQLSGYPSDRQYIIIDEVTSQVYNKSDSISLRNNISLIVRLVK